MTADAEAGTGDAAEPATARPGMAAPATPPSATPPSAAPAPIASAAPVRASDPQVAAALARLEELGTTPVGEHVAVFEDVHRRLTGVLGGLDEERAPGEGRS